MKLNEAIGSGKIGNPIVGTSTVLVALLALWGLTAQAVPPPMGVAPVLTPAGGFAIDGNLLANTPGANTGDWLPGPGGTGGSVLDANGVPLNPGTTFHSIDPYNSNDDTFGGGLKWTDNPNTWRWTTGSASAKTDINNVLLHVGSDANGHTWVIIAADRASTSGDSYIDFEFLQNTLTKNSNGSFTSAGPNGGRTTNDVVLSLDFGSGGSVPDFLAYRWLPNGSGGFAYVDATANLPTGMVFAAASPANTSVPFGAFGQTSYAGNAFVEAAVDMTVLLGNFNSCLSIGVKTIMVKTKTSTSSTASIVDFIAPVQYSMKLGPSANAGSDQTVCVQGDSTAFPLNAKASPGLYPLVSTNWTVVSGTATIDFPNALTTTAHISSGSATLRLTVVQANGCTETDDVVLTVAPLPACSITGPALLCPQASAQFSAPAGMTGYSWSVTGNGSISGAANARTVTVASGGSCGTNFTVSLVVTSNTCSSTCTTDVMVNDTVAPTLTIPVDATLQCPADTRTNVTGLATAQDDCGKVTLSYSDSVTSGCGGTKVIARTWTATDLCGNSTSAVQTITVQDTTPPSLTWPGNVVLECPADTSTNKNGTATAWDACGPATVSYSDVVSNSCGGSQVITRIWTATDSCGNATNAIQIITVRDTKPATLSVPANVVLECPADTGTNNTGVATALDACGSVTITYSDSVSNSCGGAKVISRLWTATDACGNATNRLQVITVRDTTPPAIVCPANVVLECPADISTNNNGTATALDACGTVTIVYSDVVSNSCGGSKTIWRTWTATDACGNRTNAVQTLSVRDTTAPSISAPANVVLECPADISTNKNGVATALDPCSSVGIAYSDTVSNGCGGSKVISRLWTATDACGNSASALQTLSVRDTTAPAITAPANVVLECPADISTNKNGVATALDTCSSVTIAYSDSVSNSCGGSKVISRLWTATDACGNSASALQTLTVRDTTPPTVTPPANVILECPADVSTNKNGLATALDTCSSVTITYSDSVSNGCGGSKIISRLWTATDACGNSASALQTLTVRDTTPPTITAPANVVLECPADISTNKNGVATAVDACSSVTIAYSDTVSNSCGGSKVISRLWTATDSCGNSASALQTLTVRDTKPPTVTPPANVVLECPADISTNKNGVATALDACSSVIAITYSDTVSNTCGNSKVISRLWTATDACGNSGSALQTLTVRDSTPPTITAPANVVLECPADLSTNKNGVATAWDTCGTVTITYSDSVSNTCGGAKTVNRTWMATDSCGNRANAVQTLTVRDTVPPAFLCPADLALECGADTRTNATGVPIVSDACSSVLVSYSDSVSNSCGGARTIWRAWTAADACGNSTNGLQTITVRDTTPPALTLPANLVQECPGDTRTNVTGTAIARDACGAVALSYSDVVSNGCGLTRTVWRLWTATDGCGNSTNGLQTIRVQDTTPPRIICPTIAVQCPDDVPPAYTNLAAFLAAGGTASNHCGSVLTFSQTSDSGLVGRCPGTVTRVYQIADECGNVAVGTQTITVDDTIPPVLTCPTNVTVQCGLSLNPTNTGPATATDNCATNVSITYSDALVQSIYNYNINFYGADPAYSPGPNQPPYARLAPSSLPCPASAILTGRAADPLHNAVAFGPTANQLAALTSLGGVPLSFGQIVPFEAVIGITGSQGAGHGRVQFTIDWSTYTTSNDRFGFDTNYMVYCAFVDTADAGTINPNHYAKLDSYSSKLVNAGTSSEAIEGTFQVSGLDVGDQVVVEIWLVMMSTQPAHVGGTIASQIVSAQSLDPNPQPVGTGSKTISLGNLNKMTPLPAPQPQPGPTPPPPPLPVPGVTVAVWNRTWTATDDCNNQSSCVQRITVRDTAPPVIVAPNLVLEYPADTGTNATGVALAQDACGSVTALTYSDIVSNTCGGTKVVFRTWTATDDSGNTTNVVQTITVRDTTPPAIVLPADVVLEYPANTGTNATGVATATDTDGAVTVAYSDVVSNTCGSAAVTFRTWTATDVCGNTANAVQTITVQDTTPPTISAPANVVLECPADTSTNTTGVATGADTAGAVTITFSDAINGSKIITRTWTATDPCGNATSAVQIITVRDTTPPTITYALVNTLGKEAYAGNNFAAQGALTNFATVFPTGLVIGSSNTNTLIAGQDGLLWEGNMVGQATLAALLSQTGGTSGPITQDAVNPTDTFGGGDLALQTITLTLNIGYNQAGVIGAGPNNFGTLLYSNTNGIDSLSGLTVRQILAAANAALGGQGLPAGYDFTSLAALIGQLNLSFPDYTVSPWAASSLSAPMIVVQCASQIPAPDPTHVIVSDACSNPVTVTNLPDAITASLNPGNYTILRTWVATDAAGNSASTSFQILVSDTTPPTLVAPPDQTVTAGTAWGFAQPAASDNCSSVTASVLSTVTNSTSQLLGQSAVAITRTWTATDAAGNTTTCQQTVTVVSPPPQPPPTIATSPLCQTVGSGNNTTLTVTPGGSGPFTYQWQLNGTNIAGATTSSLPLNTLQLTNAGLYTVVVGNSGGSVTSSAAVVNVLPTLAMQVSGSMLKLTWPGPFRLQSASSARGPYTDIAGATSPYVVNMSTNPARLFRLSSGPANLALQRIADGQVSLSSPGVLGCNFILQASTNLVNWVNLATNPSPFVVMDSDASQYVRRFYRAVLASTPQASPPQPPPTISAQPVSEVAAYGNSATLSVTATGSGPFTYQWRLNGTDIPGATAGSLTLTGLEFTNGGSYTVVVGNSSGSVTSQAAVLTVAPTLTAQVGSQGLTLSWPGSFILQGASSPAGPYADIPGATSPYDYNTQALTQQFFRLRSGP